MGEPKAIARDARFDILKGIAILAVLVHHVSGFGLSAKWHGPETTLAIEYANRLVRFAVPTFILLSVFLVGRGVAAREDFRWSHYLVKRLKGTVYPYMVWTLLYLGLHAFAGRSSSPMAAMGFKSSEPVAVVKTLGWIFGFGKASFHLYFMVALLQVQLILPFLIRGGKRLLGTELWKWVLVGIVAQVAIYFLSRSIGVYCWSRGSDPPLPPFSSMFYGYLLPTVVGAGLAVCLGAKIADGQTEFPSGWLVWLLPAAIFIPYAINDVTARFPVMQEGLFMAYSTAAGIALLSLCGLIKGRASSVFALLGAESLGIYLLHPIVLEILRSRTAFIGTLLLPEVWVFLVTLGVTCGTLWILRLCRLDRILFGR